MDKKLFGQQLQKYRERAGYSQEGLAEYIGCGSIFISYIERGTKSPGVCTLMKLAQVLDISVYILLGSEWKDYSIAKLKDVEGRLISLPIREQQKILEIFDSVIRIATDYCNEKGREEK